MERNFKQAFFRLDGAWASFELMAIRKREDYLKPFRVVRCKIDEQVEFQDTEVTSTTEATVLIEIFGAEELVAADGRGPVHAVDNAMRKVLEKHYPQLSEVRLEEFDVRWVILGHSERRSLLGEGDAFIRRKLEFTLSKGLQPILCVGESPAEREAGRAEAVVGGQLRSALEGLQTEGGNLLVAYEPVWAIGTGKVATPELAAAMHRFIRGTAAQLQVPVSVLYGGSVTPANIGELLAGAECDGFLVGGASLSAGQFLQLAAICAAV